MAETSAGEMIIKHFAPCISASAAAIRTTVLSTIGWSPRGITRKTPIIFYGLKLFREGRLVLGLDA